MGKQLLGDEQPQNQQRMPVSAAAPQPASDPVRDEQPAAKAEPARAFKRWRILDDVRVSMNGHICVFAKGAVLDESHYPPGAMRVLRDAGAKVEEVR